MLRYYGDLDIDLAYCSTSGKPQPDWPSTTLNSVMKALGPSRYEEKHVLK